MNDSEFEEWIKQDEESGQFKSHVYRCPKGHLTIGYGTNLDAGITEKQALALMRCEIEECKDQLSKCRWYTKQSDNIRYALLNMCYNLGFPRLCLFKKMIYHLDHLNYADAAMESLNSTWAQQVGNRAFRIADIIKEGK